MFKRFAGLLLLVTTTAVFMLTGCQKPAEPAKEAAKSEAPAVASSAPAEKTAEPSTAPAATQDIKIAMVLGNLGDMGFTDEAYAGLMRAKDELGVQVDYVECPVASEAETQLRMFADTEEYDLVMVLGADKKDAVETVAMDYPEQKFSIIDTGVEDGIPNLHGVGARDPEQTFLSGVIAGLVTIDNRMPLANDKNIICFVGGMDSPASRAGAAGFLSGAKFVNPEIEIIYTIIGDYRNPNKAKEIALTTYDRGADIISHNAGGSGLGVFNAAAEIDKYVIGSSKATADPDHSLCTSMKLTDVFVYQEIEAIVNNAFVPGTTRKGIKEGACDYDIEGLKTNVPADIIQKVDEIKQMIIDGKLTLPTDPNDIDKWLETNTYEKLK